MAEEEARKLEDPNIHFVSERRGGGGGGGDVRGESKRHVVVIFFPMTHTKAQYSCTDYNVVLQSLSVYPSIEMVREYISEVPACLGSKTFTEREL